MQDNKLSHATVLAAFLICSALSYTGTSRSIGIEPVHQSRGTSSITWCMCTTSHNSFAHKRQGPPAFCWHKGGKAALVLLFDKCFEELAYLGRHGKKLMFKLSSLGPYWWCRHMHAVWLSKNLLWFSIGSFTACHRASSCVPRAFCGWSSCWCELFMLLL